MINPRIVATIPSSAPQVITVNQRASWVLYQQRPHEVLTDTALAQPRDDISQDVVVAETSVTSQAVLGTHVLGNQDPLAIAGVDQRSSQLPACVEHHLVDRVMCRTHLACQHVRRYPTQQSNEDEPLLRRQFFVDGTVHCIHQISALGVSLGLETTCCW